MPNKSAAEKAHVKPGMTVGLVNPIDTVVDAVGLPEGVSFVEPTDADLTFVFVHRREDLETVLRPATESLAPGRTIWAFFRKGSSAMGLDMSRNDVWAVAEASGLRPLGLVSIDGTWTAFRLKRPIA